MSYTELISELEKLTEQRKTAVQNLKWLHELVRDYGEGLFRVAYYTWRDNRAEILREIERIDLLRDQIEAKLARMTVQQRIDELNELAKIEGIYVEVSFS